MTVRFDSLSQGRIQTYGQPAFSRLPSFNVTGPVSVGDVLTIDRGAATGAANITTVQLRRGATGVGGDRGATYTVDVADVGFTLALRGTAVGPGGTTLATGPSVGPVQASADFVVTSDAEWNAVFANSAATLVGKTVEIVGSNFTTRTIANRDMWAAGGRLTIRSRNASASIPALSLSGTVRGIDFSGLNFQMTGWPAIAQGCVNFGAGTFGKLRFLNGTTFRHGYGTGLANIDTAAELPEYARVNNVRTATTTSQTFPLSWQNAAMTEGWIEFFNRGTNPVRVAVGGSGVVASGTSTLIAAGTRGRISGLNPTTATHFAVLATTGTSEVNARTEIGLAAYLAQGFFATGGVTVEDLEFRNCIFRDLSNGIKGFPNCQSLIAMDCDFDRIYQDIYSFGLQTGGSAHLYRSLESIPFCRSGIAENQNGDARDPHGDHLQMFSSGGGALGPIYYGGNRIRRGNLRANVGNQGVLLSDNDFTPSYDGVFLISTMQVGGAPIGVYIGESGFPVRNVMVYGLSIVDATNAASTQPNFTLVPDTSNTVYAGSVIAPNITEFTPVLQENNLILTAGNAASVFPNIADLGTATTRAQIEAAMTTAGVGAGRGAVATGNAIDWTTADHTAVILWQNVPSGAVWADPSGVEANTMTTLPLRKILNRRAGQTVSVGAGTEWRSVAADGTTEVQAWTASPGTVQPDQFIQMRRMSGAIGEALVASITINGFTETAQVRAGVASPAVSLLRPATAAYFQSPTNIPAATTRIQMRGVYRFTALTGAFGIELMSSTSTPVQLIVNNNGSIFVRVEDAPGTVCYEGVIAPAGTIATNNWYDIEVDADHATNQVRVTVNGTSFTAAFTTEGTNVFPNNRAVTFLAGSGGANSAPSGTRAADMRVWYNGTLSKTIPNDATAANADAWKLGAGVFTNA